MSAEYCEPTVFRRSCRFYSTKTGPLNTNLSFVDRLNGKQEHGWDLGEAIHLYRSSWLGPAGEVM